MKGKGMKIPYLRPNYAADLIDVYWENGLGVSSILISWGQVWNAEPQAPPQTCQIRSCSLMQTVGPFVWTLRFEKPRTSPHLLDVPRTLGVHGSPSNLFICSHDSSCSWVFSLFLWLSRGPQIQCHHGLIFIAFSLLDVSFLKTGTKSIHSLSQQLSMSLKPVLTSLDLFLHP